MWNKQSGFTLLMLLVLVASCKKKEPEWNNYNGQYKITNVDESYYREGTDKDTFCILTADTGKLNLNATENSGGEMKISGLPLLIFNSTWKNTVNAPVITLDGSVDNTDLIIGNITGGLAFTTWQYVRLRILHTSGKTYDLMMDNLEGGRNTSYHLFSVKISLTKED